MFTYSIIFIHLKISLHAELHTIPGAFLGTGEQGIEDKVFTLRGVCSGKEER